MEGSQTGHLYKLIRYLPGYGCEWNRVSIQKISSWRIGVKKILDMHKDAQERIQQEDKIKPKEQGKSGLKTSVDAMQLE